MKMQLLSPVLNTNMLLITIKKAFEQGIVLLSRHIYRSIPFQADGVLFKPSKSFLAHPHTPAPNDPKPSQDKDRSSNLLSFEDGLNAIESELYTPFAMHMEGYRNCEIADYLGLTEEQVLFTINKVRATLELHHAAAKN